MLDVHSTLVSNGEDLAIHRVQEIPEDFLDTLKSERFASAHLRAAEQHRVASIPVALVEIWLRQGFDFYRAPPREIVAKLRKDGLEDFLTTSKAI